LKIDVSSGMSNTAPNSAEPFQIFHPLRRYAVAPLDGAPRDHVEVGKFVILSMLLHVLFVVLFGDSTGGGSSRASQMLGGFSASLQARVTNNAPASPSIKSATTSGADANPRASRTTAPVKIEPLKPSLAPAESIDAANAAPVAVTPQTAPEKVSVPDALPTISKSVVKPVSEFVVAPAEVTPKAVVETVPPVDPLPPLPRAQALTVPKPIELNANPGVSREFAPYVPPILPPTLPPSIAPILPTAPIAPLAMPPVTPLALPTIAAPKIEREFVAPANIEVREPLVVPPPISTIAPTTELKTEREFAPYVPPTVVPNVAPSPATTAPNTVPNTTSSPPATTTPAERNFTPAPSSSTPATTTAPANERAPAATPGSPTPSKSADDVFGPRRDVSPAAAPAPAKSLDLDAARRSAREGANERTGPKTLLPFPTAPKPIPKSDMTKIFDKALKRPDCKDAYAEMGLAAVIPLVRDAIKQEGCKW
jgi:hypothetical protein